ncbi:MAG: hypothetical protein AAFX65_05715 [Cyanobacteria bacterium J06638_7]
MDSSILIVLLFLPLALVAAEGRWRTGILYTVVVGFLQDPLRKISAGQPAAFSALIILAFAIACMPLLLRGAIFDWRRMFFGNVSLRGTLNLVLLLIGVQSLHSLVRFGSPQLTLLGLLFYLAPLIAVGAGYWCGLSPLFTGRWLRLYIGMAIVFSASLWLSYAGWDLKVFEEVGGGISINLSEAGLMIPGFSGLWRTSEIAAWHMAAASCFLVVLGASTRHFSFIAGALTIAAAILMLATLTGRRKALVLAAAFGVLYPLLLRFSANRQNLSRLQQAFLLVALAALVVVLFAFTAPFAFDDLDPVAEGFLARASSTWGDLGERVLQLGVGSLGWASSRAGWLGFGVGAGAQGAQYLDVAAAQRAVGGAAEAGSGKLLIELGIPGMAALLVLLYQLGKLLIHNCRVTAALLPREGIICCGLTAFVAANIPVFLVASQIYGDPFVLLILGLSVGVILASPHLIPRLISLPQQAAAQPGR